MAYVSRRISKASCKRGDSEDETAVEGVEVGDVLGMLGDFRPRRRSVEGKAYEEESQAMSMVNRH